MSARDLPRTAAPRPRALYRSAVAQAVPLGRAIQGLPDAQSLRSPSLAVAVARRWSSWPSRSSGACRAFAQSRHRARLSRDLAERLGSASRRPPTSSCRRATPASTSWSARYGVRLKKRIDGRRGARGDRRPDRRASARIPTSSTSRATRRSSGMMAVTTQATGADQVWAGLGGLRGVRPAAASASR